MGTRKHKTHLDDEQKADLVRRYRGGESAKDLADEFDVHPATVFTINKAYDDKAPKRARGENLRKLTDEQVKEIAKRYKAGERMADLASEFGIHESTAYGHMGRINLGLRHLPKTRGNVNQSLVLASPKKAKRPEFIDIPLKHVERMTENESNGRLAIIVCQDKNLSTVLGELWK